MYENEDQLLWNPELLPEKEVVEFLAEASKRIGEQTGADPVPERPLIKDNEEVTHCQYYTNIREAVHLDALRLKAIVYCLYFRLSMS